MKRKDLLTTFILFLCISGLYAQPPPDCPPYPAAEGCGFADPDCQNGLNGYCNTLDPQDQNTEPLPGCGGTYVLNNDDWIAFFAGSTSITVVITPDSCQSTGGNQGIQAGFYGGCDDGGGPNGDGAAFDPLQLQCACTTNPITLDYDNFVVGQTYYIVIDGCGGDICDYVIEVTEGSTQSFPPDDLTAIYGPSPICPGAIVEYSTDIVNGIPAYEWTVNGGTIIGDPTGNPIQIQWTTSGSISVFGVNDCYTTNTVNLSVTVDIPPPGDDEGEYCAGSTYIYPGNSQSYTAGQYTIDFPGQGNNGCDSSVVLVVTENPTPSTDLFHTICEGEEIVVGGETYNSNGQWTIVLLSSFGCDSTVYLDLTVLDPYAFVIQPPPINCYFDQVVIDGSLSMGDAYEWSTFDGCIDGSNTIPIITACDPGNYCLTVTSFGMDQGQSMECTEEFCIEVLDDTEGAEIETSGTDVTCESSNDGTTTADFIDSGLDPDDFIFVWNSVPIQFTQTATNLAGGNYCVTVTSIDNGCTSEACFNISAPPAIFIDIVGEDILCNGDTEGTATAIVSGGIPGYTYLWDDPQAQTDATATGLPAGSYTIIVTDVNGCTESGTVDILEPDAMQGTLSSEDAGCNGEDSGSATIEVIGGTGLLSYEWNTNPSQDSSTAINLVAGDYTVLVTDENGCTIEENYTISEPAAMQLTESSSQTSCNNTSDGSATVSASGGVTPYTYLWDDPNAQTTATAIDLMSGDFTVIVTDANGCSSQVTVTVSSPNGMTVVPDFTDPLCNGGTDGSATVPTTGGTSPYTYTWDDPNGQTTETATGLSAGTYNVTIEDTNGCEEYETIIIGEPTAISLTSTTVDALCNTDENGSATVTASGGTPGAGYTYLWDDANGQTTATATGLGVGTYTVEVTDENGCTSTETVTITEPAVLSLATSQTDALCNQVADGTATVTPSGGTSPYTYLWDDGGSQATSTATNLLAGDYTVLVTDTNGCTDQATVTISEPPALVLATGGTDPDCNTSQDGTATVTPSGGTSPYTYIWDDPNGQTNSTANGLDGGTFTVVVTDGNGCTETQSVDLVAPTAIALTISGVNILCFEDETGSATVTANGGSSPYTYLWDDAATQNTETAVNLGAGTYIVIVTDDNDCTAQIMIDLTEPAAALSATGTSTDALCGVDNGTIDLTPTGGTSPYTYLWSNNDTNQDPQNLGAGTYTVVVTDANDCTFTTSVQVSTPNGLEAIVDVTEVTCNGETNGIVDVTVSGGIAPYGYDWGVNGTNPDLIDVGAGNYNLIVTDSDGCTITVSALVEEPDVLDATATPSQASCGLSDGSISLVVSGGTGNYTFDWDNDGTGDNDDDQSPNALPQGDYIVVVTDENGCSLTIATSVTVPNGPVVNISAINLSCFEDASGIIELEVVGGDAPYTYEWSDGAYDPQGDYLTGVYAGSWSVLVTDDNNCSSTASIVVTEPSLFEVSAAMTAVSCFGETDGTVTAQTTGGTGVPTFSWDVTDPNAAAAGIYTVTATDENGCTAEATIEVTQPTALQASASALDVDCNGSSTGSLQSQVSGGTLPYSYLWTVIGSTDPNPTDVVANVYTVIVTDGNGCTVLAQTEVMEPEVLTASSQIVESSCGDPNGSIDLTVNGGVSPYTYLWDDSNNQTDEDPQNLVPGLYLVLITDANGCTLEYGETVTTPSALIISGNGFDVDCYGSNTGSTDITVGGGTQPFSYLWDDSNNQTVEDADNLPAGSYTVIVTDASGCTISTTILISEPPPFEATSLGATSVSCNGGDDGSIVITVTGGTIPYVLYEWDNTSQSVPDPDNLSAGTYTLTVTDNQGCTAVSEAIVISEPEAMLLTTTSQAAFCNGSSDGSIDLTVNGGTAPYTYDWNNGQYIDEDPSNVGAGSYTVIVTDAEGCSQSTTAVVDEPVALQILIDNVSNYGGYNVTCWNSADGTAEALASGGTTPFSYSWSNGANTGAISDLDPGLYVVTVTDGGGCTNTTQVELTAPQAIDAFVQSVAADCHGENDGQVIVETVSGGAPPYMYSIGSTFSPTNQFVNLPAGDYEVIVQDVNGCEWTGQATVTEPAEFTVSLGPDELIEMGDSTQLFPVLSPSGSVMDTFVWKEREVTEFQPWVGPWQTQSYSIVVTNQNGCKSEDMILVRVNKDRLVYIPNTFTPNNDGFNDIFYIQTGRGVASINNFRIFSRWGELVYEHLNPQVGLTYGDPNNGWDGTLGGEPMNPAVFVYVVEVTFIDGRVETYKGDVTLAK